MDRYEAFVHLLSLPDPVDLPPRRRVLTYPGDPVKQEALIERSMRAFIARRRMEREPEVLPLPAQKAKRRRIAKPIPKLVRFA